MIHERYPYCGPVGSSQSGTRRGPSDADCVLVVGELIDDAVGPDPQRAEAS
jgi:hypothetical protein